MAANHYFFFLMLLRAQFGRDMGEIIAIVKKSKRVLGHSISLFSDGHSNDLLF
jgi:hypothetical protein